MWNSVIHFETQSQIKKTECRNLQRQDKLIPDRTDRTDSTDSTDSTDLKSIQLWLTSTTDASEEVLIMRPTTYFFIPAEHMKALEVHSHLSRSRPLLPTQKSHVLALHARFSVVTVSSRRNVVAPELPLHLYTQQQWSKIRTAQSRAIQNNGDTSRMQCVQCNSWLEELLVMSSECWLTGRTLNQSKDCLYSGTSLNCNSWQRTSWAPPLARYSVLLADHWDSSTVINHSDGFDPDGILTGCFDCRVIVTEFKTPGPGFMTDLWLHSCWASKLLTRMQFTRKKTQLTPRF